MRSVILLGKREKLTYKTNNVEINTISVAIWILISPKHAKLEGEHFIGFLRKEQVVLSYV